MGVYWKTMMSTVKILSDVGVDGMPATKAVFDDIRGTCHTAAACLQTPPRRRKCRSSRRSSSDRVTVSIRYSTATTL